MLLKYYSMELKLFVAIVTIFRYNLIQVVQKRDKKFLHRCDPHLSKQPFIFGNFPNDGPSSFTFVWINRLYNLSLSGRWFCSFCDVMLLGLYSIQFKQFFFWPLHVTKGNHSVSSFFSSQDRFSSQHKMQAFPTNFLVCPLKENILTKKLGEKAFVLRGDLQCSWRYWEQKQSILMMLSAFISALRFPAYIRYVSFNWLFKSLCW